MAKKPSTDLYDLIKVLTPTERRYMHLYFENQDSKYLQLLGAIYEQESYDEEALRVLMYGQAQLETQKFSELKRYLYESVLSQLHQYDGSKSVHFKFERYLLSIEVLFRRNLLEQCKTIVRRLRKIAERYERNKVLLECLFWERRIAYAGADIDYLSDNLERIQQEEQLFLDRESNLSAYRDLFFNTLIFLRKNYTVRSAEQEAKMKEFLENPLLHNEDFALTTQSTIYYHRIWSTLRYLQLDFEGFYESNLILKKLLEDASFLNDDVSEYIAVMSNLVYACRITKRFEQGFVYLDNLKNINPLNEDDALKIHRQFHQNFFSISIATGKFERGYAVLQEHLKVVEKFPKDQFFNPTFYFQYFSICYGAEQFEEAMDWLNEGLNLPRTQERKDLQIIGKILNAVLHFELGNLKYLESLINQDRRYLRSQKGLYEFETKMIHFFKRYLKAITKTKRREAYERLQSDFEELSKNEKNQQLLTGYFNFPAWLDAKTSGIRFSQAVENTLSRTPDN